MTVVNKKFLLADDDVDDTEIFIEALSQIAPDIQCHTAENGLELFEWLSKHPDKPDVIFLDINMPLMNGWETLKKLKDTSDYRGIPIIMYSTSSAKRDVDRAYQLGVSLFLTKPEDYRELSEILRIVATNSKDELKRQLTGFYSVKTC